MQAINRTSRCWPTSPRWDVPPACFQSLCEAADELATFTATSKPAKLPACGTSGHAKPLTDCHFSQALSRVMGKGAIDPIDLAWYPRRHRRIDYTGAGETSWPLAPPAV
jgi:hypothetical protein